MSAVKKDGQTVSGDKGTYFKTDDGMLYILLSDGMGTGDDARSLSADAVRIIERFLRAGTRPEIALRLMNGLMLLKNDISVSCATVDLMCIDLFSGETKIFKYGAARLI